MSPLVFRHVPSNRSNSQLTSDTQQGHLCRIWSNSSSKVDEPRRSSPPSCLLHPQSQRRRRKWRFPPASSHHGISKLVRPRWSAPGSGGGWGGSCHRTRTGWNPVQLGGSCGEFTDRTEMGIWKPTLIICSTKRTFVSTKEFKGGVSSKKKL